MNQVMRCKVIKYTVNTNVSDVTEISTFLKSKMSGSLTEDYTMNEDFMLFYMALALGN